MHTSTYPLLLLSFVTACANAPNSNNETPVGSSTQHLDADADGAAAILETRSGIAPELQGEYFDLPLEPVALATPDGRGAFQFFEGTSGVGAIYSDSKAVVASFVGGYREERVTQPIYGAILSFYARYGFETLLGYPRGPERPASWCASQGAVREQEFGTVNIDFGDALITGPQLEARQRWDGRVRICWSPERGAWADGLLDNALQGEFPATPAPDRLLPPSNPAEAAASAGAPVQ